MCNGMPVREQQLPAYFGLVHAELVLKRVCDSRHCLSSPVRAETRLTSQQSSQIDEQLVRTSSFHIIRHGGSVRQGFIWLSSSSLRLRAFVARLVLAERHNDKCAWDEARAVHPYRASELVSPAGLRASWRTISAPCRRTTWLKGESFIPKPLLASVQEGQELHQRRSAAQVQLPELPPATCVPTARNIAASGCWTCLRAIVRSSWRSLKRSGQAGHV